MDAAVSPELAARIEWHLKNCKHCTAVLDGTRNTVRLLADGDWYELPDGFSERLYNELARRCR